MVQELTKEPVGYQWALPENVDIPRDELKVRLDFYGQSVVMYVLEEGIVTTKMVSAQDVALALLRDIPLGSGVLPENTLWWQHRQDGAPVVALWRLSPDLAGGLAVGAFQTTAAFQVTDARTDLYMPSGKSSQSGRRKETANDTRGADLSCPALQRVYRWEYLPRQPPVFGRYRQNSGGVFHRLLHAISWR